MKKITVIIPAYNEEESLPILYERMDKLMESMKNYEFEILFVNDRCKEDKKITHYELESIQHSAEIYFKLKGNSFIEALMEKVKEFEITD